ncbi:hypothetical protein [Sphingomonas glacialis]|uniref:Uncharacterized protein n=1 Tax=Sphingomonas glacialis TaxID=658225 RepID=A0A502FCL0_9SPHN|nr:hypothetical protein [Sphingomonas glacialis]TPG47039.1 hypothetical protein EAH76_22935 [Sphingomonas glacialis]
MPFRKIFLSRWAALLWAAGIVWTAVDIVGFGPPAAGRHAILPAQPSDDTDATGVAVNSDDLAVLANAIRQ